MARTKQEPRRLPFALSVCLPTPAPAATQMPAPALPTPAAPPEAPAPAPASATAPPTEAPTHTIGPIATTAAAPATRAHLAFALSPSPPLAQPAAPAVPPATDAHPVDDFADITLSPPVEDATTRAPALTAPPSAPAAATTRSSTPPPRPSTTAPVYEPLSPPAPVYQPLSPPAPADEPPSPTAAADEPPPPPPRPPVATRPSFAPRRITSRATQTDGKHAPRCPSGFLAYDDDAHRNDPHATWTRRRTQLHDEGKDFCHRHTGTAGPDSTYTRVRLFTIDVQAGESRAYELCLHLNSELMPPRPPSFADLVRRRNNYLRGPRTARERSRSAALIDTFVAQLPPSWRDALDLRDRVVLSPLATNIVVASIAEVYPHDETAVSRAFMLAAYDSYALYVLRFYQWARSFIATVIHNQRPRLDWRSLKTAVAALLCSVPYGLNRASTQIAMQLYLDRMSSAEMASDATHLPPPLSDAIRDLDNSPLAPPNQCHELQVFEFPTGFEAADVILPPLVPTWLVLSAHNNAFFPQKTAFELNLQANSLLADWRENRQLGNPPDESPSNLTCLLPIWHHVYNHAVEPLTATLAAARTVNVLEGTLDVLTATVTKYIMSAHFAEMFRWCKGVISDLNDMALASLRDVAPPAVFTAVAARVYSHLAALCPATLWRDGPTYARDVFRHMRPRVKAALDEHLEFLRGEGALAHAEYAHIRSSALYSGPRFTF